MDNWGGDLPALVLSDVDALSYLFDSSRCRTEIAEKTFKITQRDVEEDRKKTGKAAGKAGTIRVHVIRPCEGVCFRFSPVMLIDQQQYDSTTSYLREEAQLKTIDRRRKCIIISHAEALPLHSQKTIRSIIDKHQSNILVVLVTSKLSTIDMGLISRSTVLISRHLKKLTASLIDGQEIRPSEKSSFKECGTVAKVMLDAILAKGCCGRADLIERAAKIEWMCKKASVALSTEEETSNSAHITELGIQLFLEELSIKCGEVRLDSATR